MGRAAVLDWLLEEDEPGARYLALRDLEHRPSGDPELRSARSAVLARGWGAALSEGLLAPARPLERSEYYRPKYGSPHWRLLVLSDLGVRREDPEVARAAEAWMAAFPLRGGGVGGNSTGNGHHCVVGNMVRGLIELGYGDDPRVAAGLEWLVETADPKGGWSCFGSGRNLDSWEGLSAFAAYPRARWTAPMERTVERATEFFLERELHRQGARYAPWWRFHYPVHYYYDLLVGLDLVTALGRTDDPRLTPARSHLESKRRRDGRWILDAAHPDVDGAMVRWYAAHPKDRPSPLELEPVGRPSKLVTLRALRVLDRFDGTG